MVLGAKILLIFPMLIPLSSNLPLGPLMAKIYSETRGMTFAYIKSFIFKVNELLQKSKETGKSFVEVNYIFHSQSKALFSFASNNTIVRVFRQQWNILKASGHVGLVSFGSQIRHELFFRFAVNKQHFSTNLTFTKIQFVPIFCSTAFVKIHEVSNMYFCGFQSAFHFYGKLSQTVVAVFITKCTHFHAEIGHQVIQRGMISSESYRELPQLHSTFVLNKQFSTEIVHMFEIKVGKTQSIKVHSGWWRTNFVVFVDGPITLYSDIHLFQLKPHRGGTAQLTFQSSTYQAVAMVIPFWTRDLPPKLFRIACIDLVAVDVTEATKVTGLNMSVSTKKTTSKTYVFHFKAPPSFGFNISVQNLEFEGPEDFLCSHGGMGITDIILYKHQPWRKKRIDRKSLCSSDQEHTPFQRSFVSSNERLYLHIYNYKEHSSINVTLLISTTTCRGVSLCPCLFYVHCLSQKTTAAGCQNFQNEAISHQTAVSISINVTSDYSSTNEQGSLQDDMTCILRKAPWIPTVSIKVPQYFPHDPICVVIHIEQSNHSAQYGNRCDLPATFQFLSAVGAERSTYTVYGTLAPTGYPYNHPAAQENCDHDNYINFDRDSSPEIFMAQRTNDSLVSGANFVKPISCSKHVAFFTFLESQVFIQDTPTFGLILRQSAQVKTWVNVVMKRKNTEKNM